LVERFFLLLGRIATANEKRESELVPLRFAEWKDTGTVGY
jgi:hypothetical protein